MVIFSGFKIPNFLQVYGAIYGAGWGTDLFEENNKKKLKKYCVGSEFHTQHSYSHYCATKNQSRLNKLQVHCRDITVKSNWNVNNKD